MAAAAEDCRGESLSELNPFERKGNVALIVLLLFGMGSGVSASAPSVTLRYGHAVGTYSPQDLGKSSVPKLTKAQIV